MKIILKYISAVILGAVVVCATAHTKSHKPRFLFTQVARTATFTPLSAANQYKLVLHDVNGKVLWFTDRPERKHGHMSVANYVNLWKKQGANSFGDNNPNADLAYVTHKDNVRVQGQVVMRLLKASYNDKKNQMIYTADLLTAASEVPQHTREVALFVDSSGGCTKVFPCCTWPFSTISSCK